MGSLALDIGRALRRIRKERGLTLREVAATSGGAFKATSIAGYERGERSITLERFVLLCDLYDVRAGEVLADVHDTTDDRGAAIPVNLVALERLAPQERELLSALVRQVRERREPDVPGRVMVRADDLAVLATASGSDPEELLDALRGGAGAPSDRDDVS